MFAFTLLSIAELTVLVFQAALPSSNFWPSFLALVPMMGLLVVAKRMRTLLWSLLYLLVGGVAVHLYALGLLNQSIPVDESDGFTFLAVKAALISVGGVVLGTRAGIIGAVAGYITAELSVGLAVAQSALPLRFDVPALVILLVNIVIVSILGVKDPRQMWALPRLQRAAHEEHLASLRYKIEVQAAMLMHDTVLNQLAAVADSNTKQLDPMLREQIQRDVESLTSEEWLAESSVKFENVDRARSAWLHSGLYTAIREGRLLGLSVTTSGDLTAVSRLSREASSALGLAVKQCLVNVLKHSGTRDAEVAVYSSESEVSVMVIDNGRGFVESAAGNDRLGLRSSVRRRIELVGGMVNVWSTPGRGASIVIQVPTKHDTKAVHTEGVVEAT